MITKPDTKTRRKNYQYLEKEKKKEKTYVRMDNKIKRIAYTLINITPMQVSTKRNENIKDITSN